MGLYPFVCPACGAAQEVVAPMSSRPTAQTCGSCGAAMRRIYTAPAILRPLVTETHYNRSLGEVVTSTADFRSKLARKSDEMSARTGLEQRLAPVAPGDVEPPGAREQLRRRQIEREGRAAKVIL